MSGVYSHRLIIKITRNKIKRVFNDLQLQFIKENYNNMTYLEMSKLELFNGLTSKQIRTKASTMGLKKKRQFNKNYFYDIDSEEKAYWLGLIYADGYVTDNNEFGIELEIKTLTDIILQVILIR